MRMWSPCRHEEVFWIDAHTCCCHECGKTGIWYEEGLVLWCRRRPPRMPTQVAPSTTPSQSAQFLSQRPLERLSGVLNEALAMGHGEREPLVDHPATSHPLALEPAEAVRQRSGLPPVAAANRRASA